MGTRSERRRQFKEKTLMDDLDRTLDKIRQNLIAFYPTLNIEPDPVNLRWYLELICELEHGRSGESLDDRNCR
jgi:hypothetical protein